MNTDEIFISLTKSETKLVERFAKLIQGNEIDLEMFDRIFRNVEDANALAVLKNQLAEIANVSSLALAPQDKPKRNYPEKRKSPAAKPADKKKESDKQIKQNVQDLGKPEIEAEPDFDL